MANQRFDDETRMQLYDAIEHGSENHRRWLWDALLAFQNWNEVPPPYPEEKPQSPQVTSEWPAAAVIITVIICIFLTFCAPIVKKTLF